jgi:hypothetical protein
MSCTALPTLQRNAKDLHRREALLKGASVSTNDHSHSGKARLKASDLRNEVVPPVRIPMYAALLIRNILTVNARVL